MEEDREGRAGGTKPKTLFEDSKEHALRLFEEQYGRPPGPADLLAARHDFDLAEYPWLRFGRPQRVHHELKPMVYQDTIKGAADADVVRQWTMYPSLKGAPFPGETTQRLFLTLLHIWSAVGFEGDRIAFKTINHICQLMHGRNARGKDYQQILRDIETLQGISIDADNAFYDPRTNAYHRVTSLRFFGYAVYPSRKEWNRGSTTPFQQELPFGYVMVTPELQAIARTRSFFATGVPLRFLCGLPGQTARLAIHLSKYFIAYPVYRRKLSDLCEVIPIEVKRPRAQRERVLELAQQLLDAGYPGLQQAPKIYQNSRAEWIVEFVRGKKPTQKMAQKRLTLDTLPAHARDLVEQILEAGGAMKDLAYWAMCVEALGQTQIHRGLSEAKIFCRENSGAEFPKVLTSRFEGIAEEQGLIINPRRKVVKH